MLNEHFVYTDRLPRLYLAAYTRTLHLRIRVDYYALTITETAAVQHVEAAGDLIAQAEQILA